MKPDCSAESWLKFFTSAGIPEKSARTYAVTFSTNEIQLDMLSEIKKEYLVDMGITLMGHIIAILRHAKTVYEENVTKSTLSTSQKGQNSVLKTVPKEKPVLKTMPLRINSEKEATVTPTVTSPTKSTVTPVESRQRAVGSSTVQNISSSVTYNKSSNLQVTDKEILAKKKETDSVQKPKMSSVVSNSTTKKKSAVETSRHTEEVTSSKGKVFERLGEEVADQPLDSPESSSSNESVFSRLGGKTSPSYSPPESPAKAPYKSLPNGVDSPDYSNIKRVVQNGNRSKVKSMMCTMRADEAEAQAKRGRKRTHSPTPTAKRPKDFDMLASNVKSRLGRMSRSVSPSSRKFWMMSEKSSALSGVGEFRSDKLMKTMQGVSNFDVEEELGGNGRSSILSKRSSPTGSIGLSGLSNTTSGIKSRLGQANMTQKKESQKKSVSFGPVKQKLIPLEAKPIFNRPFRYGRLSYADEYSNNNYNGMLNFNTGSRVFSRLGY